MNTVLEKFGLSHNETRVYLGFHSNPLVSAAKLSKILKMDKSSVYRAVDHLYDLHLLVASRSRYGLVYRAVNPENLKELHKSAEAELEFNKSELFTFIEDLKTNSQAPLDPYIAVEYGIESVRKRMELNLASKEKLIRERFRDHRFFKNPQHIKFVKAYAKKRVRNRIHLKQLELEYEEMEKVFGEIMNKPNKYLKEVRILPKEFNDNNSFIIWDNNINIISETAKGEILVVSIKDPNIAQLMKNMFDFIWMQSKVVE